ncbi:MAG: D-glycerate dehydrogenase [Pseudomonadota bacterium]
MSKPRIILTRRWPEEVEEHLKTSYDVTINKDDVPMSKEQLQEALRNYDAFCPTVTDPVDAEVLGISDIKAKIIGSFGVGFNHIDLDAAKKAGLVVSNTPEVLTDCTADIAMILILTTARRIGEGERHLRNGEWVGWRPTHMRGTKVTGKTLGCIGFGRIAQATADRAHFGFGMKIIFSDPYPPPDEVIKKYNAQQCDSVEDVLSKADFVSIHCPGGESTYHLINTKSLACMQPHAFLINTARGDVVDNDALIAALENKVIAGAGLDVFEGEPNLKKDFLKFENAVLLPHLGSASKETRIAMGMRVVENLDAFFSGKEPGDRVA